MNDYLIIYKDFVFETTFKVYGSKALLDELRETEDVHVLFAYEIVKEVI